MPWKESNVLQERVKLQDEFDTFILIADVQALTDHFHEPELVRRHVFEVVLDNLAAGIEPEKVTFVIQSMIPEIAELTVFFSNLVSLSRLRQNPTVKTEIALKKELFGNSVSYGFLGYPISQAADITVFNADLVPVGEDQMPQLEQTRELVRKFNRIYGETLTLPEGKYGIFPRVKGLDGKAKMSKSLNNAIFLADSPTQIEAKVQGALTDPQKLRVNDAGHPEICTVFTYHQMFSPGIEELAGECRAGSRGCRFCKAQLTAKIIETLAPIRERREAFAQNLSEVKDLVSEGTARAKRVASETLNRVKDAMTIQYF